MRNPSAMDAPAITIFRFILMPTDQHRGLIAATLEFWIAGDCWASI
jgi:hypothetical protein